MFFGSYEHNLDEKGRLVIPSKIRANILGKLYILKGFEGSLSLYDDADFKSYIASLQALSFNNRTTRDVQRIALSSVCELEIDKQGRIQLPTALLEKYQISKEVVIVGVLDHFEIWNKLKWEQYLKDNEEDFENKSEALLAK